MVCGRRFVAGLACGLSFVIGLELAPVLLLVLIGRVSLGVPVFPGADSSAFSGVGLVLSTISRGCCFSVFPD